VGHKIGIFMDVGNQRSDTCQPAGLIFLGLVLSALCFSCTSEAYDLPIREPRIEGASVRGVLEGKHRTILGINIGRDSLDDVIKRIGPNAVNKSQDIDTRPKYLCYLSAHEGDKTLIVFYAGPLGGYQKVTSVVIAPADAYRHVPSGCKRNNRVHSGIRTDSGIGINMPLSTYTKLLPSKPYLNSKKLYEYSFETENVTKAGNRLITSVITSGLFIKTNQDSSVRWVELYFVEGN